MSVGSCHGCIGFCVLVCNYATCRPCCIFRVTLFLRCCLKFLVIRNTVSSFLKKLMLHLISPSGILTSVCLGTSQTLRLSSFFLFFPLQLPPSVLWYCWLGLLTCKNRLPYNLYCVGGDIKHCSIQSNPFLFRISCILYCCVACVSVLDE